MEVVTLKKNEIAHTPNGPIILVGTQGREGITIQFKEYYPDIEMRRTVKISQRELKEKKRRQRARDHQKSQQQ